MNEILSERAVKMHKDYLNELILRRSIFEKSYPNGVVDSYIKGSGLVRGERERMRGLSNQILAHQIFFDSFSANRYQHSDIVNKQYGDITHLLNEVFRLCMASEGVFVYIGKERGRVEMCACKEREKASLAAREAGRRSTEKRPLKGAGAAQCAVSRRRK